MPFTHVEIEERKTRSLALLFLFLIVLYAGSLVLLIGGVKVFLELNTYPAPFRVSPAPLEIALILGLSIAFGIAHWLRSTRGLFQRIVEALGARRADPHDTYHAKLLNVVGEVSVATGGRRIQTYVIPSPAMNACAFASPDGLAAIAVTEGALATLNRAQLESVVGHEAAHIASGDSLTTSVLCALFALHEEALKRLRQIAGMEGREGAHVLRGRMGLVILFIIGVLWLTRLARRIGEMFISREKEYRADAVAVRLTRNPLGLAEALRVLSRKWRGVGMRGESLSSIFIMDPGVESFSEREGWLADLFSTHPPTGRRIALLLGMAHHDPARFDEEMAASRSRRPARGLPAPAAIDDFSGQWSVWTPGGWTGPFGIREMAKEGHLVPESWVQRTGEGRAMPAYEDPLLLEALRTRYSDSSAIPTGAACPRCRIPLAAVRYEGAPLQRCPACRGCFVDSTQTAKIFSRQEYDFPEEVRRLGESLLSIRQQVDLRKRFYSTPRPPIPWSCHRCGGTVVREFFNPAYLVQVERCRACGLTWLDPQELELLQYLFERMQEGS